MDGPYEKQIMVRMPSDLMAAAQADAQANGRTLAQTVRFHLRAVLLGGAEQGECPTCQKQGPWDAWQGRPGGPCRDVWHKS